MSKIKIKLMTLLSFVFCVCSVVGIGATFSKVTVAKAATFEIPALTALDSSSATFIYAYPTNSEGEKVEGIGNCDGSWDYAFTFVEASGYGFRINGELHTGYEVKKPGDDFYISLNYTATNGTILSIDGKFYNQAKDMCFNFDNCVLVYNDGKWTQPSEKPTAPSTQGVVNNITSTSGNSTQIYLTPDKALGVSSWDLYFTLHDGAGVLYNGASFTSYGVKQPDSNLFLELKDITPVTGDILSIEGTFYNESIDTYITIPKTSLRFNGSSWYKIYETGKLVVGSESSASQLYLYKEGGSSFEVTDPDWNESLSLGDGARITLNGEQIGMGDVKVPGYMFVGLGSIAKFGSVVTISGEFYNDNLNVKYYVEEISFEWNGKQWITATDLSMERIFVEYLLATGSSNASAIYGYNDTNPIPKHDEDWANTYEFIPNSGEGILFNGKKCDYVIKHPGDLYIEFGHTANVGDVVSIDGAFHSSVTNRTFYFDYCGLKWNGSTWERVTTYNIPELTLHVNSTVGGASGNNNQLYITADEAWDNKVESWDYLFTSSDPNSFKINDQPATLAEMKAPQGFIFLSFNAVSAGDKVTVGGTFICKDLGVTYIIETSNFRWTGSGWVKLDYSNETVNSLTLPSSSTSASSLNLDGATASSTQSLTFKSGDGFRVNGTPTTLNSFTISPSGVNLEFDGLKANDKVTLSGTFVNEEQMVKYTFAEQTFIWNGEFWETKGKPVVYEVGEVIIVVKDSSNSAVYFAKANGEAFEVIEGTWTEKLTFIQNSGIGVTINGTQISMNDIKIPGSIYCGLGTTVTVGDVLAIGGSFYNETLNVRYVIEESKFVYDGTAWTTNEDYINSVTSSLNFVMLNGASIRLTSSLDNSGIRFTTTLNNQYYNDLVAAGISIEMGTLIMPYDYLSDGQAPNLQDFVVGKTILKIVSSEEKREAINGTLYFRGAMQKILTKNYSRNFAGRGYMIITMKDGEKVFIYTPFTVENNVRSIKTIATAFINDTTPAENGELRYYDFSDTDPRKTIVELYAGLTTPASASNEATNNLGASYSVYFAKNKINLIANLKAKIN